LACENGGIANEVTKVTLDGLMRPLVDMLERVSGALAIRAVQAGEDISASAWVIEQRQRTEGRETDRF
jgi:hypothetical protein